MIDPSLNLKQVREVKESKHEDELKSFEKNEVQNFNYSGSYSCLTAVIQVHMNFKWGVLYCGKGQKDENDMWHNQTGSEAFQEFLSILGDRVTLQGFKGYNGGLDTTSTTRFITLIKPDV